jgi:hypothetical protein
MTLGFVDEKGVRKQYLTHTRNLIHHQAGTFTYEAQKQPNISDETNIFRKPQKVNSEKWYYFNRCDSGFTPLTNPLKPNGVG